MNDVLVNLTKFNIRNIIEAFEISKDVFYNKEKQRIFHNGEYGGYRETVIKNWLSLYIPQIYGIDSGFVITSSNKVSTQCDIIIFDKRATPKIDNNGQRFFPIETVVAVGEIKSNIQSSVDLNKYLVKLAEIKKLRLEIKPDSEIYERRFETDAKRLFETRPDFIQPNLESPNNYLEVSFTGNPFDNIYTFLICNKFDFDYSRFHFEYGELKSFLWHNTILSLKDGIFNYITPNDTPNISYPCVGNLTLRHHFRKVMPEDEELPVLPHLRMFLTSFANRVTNTTVFKFDILKYITPDSDIIKYVK